MDKNPRITVSPAGFALYDEPSGLYVTEIVDGRTLLPVEEWEESPWIVGCITVYCGEVRLIDNIVYREPGK